MRASDLIRSSKLPRHEAERLLAAAGRITRADLIPDPDIGAGVAASFTALAKRRRRGEPLQYLEGTVQFGPVELLVDHRVLIPRPETEQLFELAVAAIEAIDAPIVVDLCTGSGNLAIAIKHQHRRAVVYATDASLDAVRVARENADRNRVSVSVRHGDLFEPLDAALAHRVDLIVANPPYVAAREVATLPPEVRDHEPHQALVAGETGDEVLAAIAAEAFDWLRPGGWLMCEISEYREATARELFAAFEPRIRPDLAGRPRFVIGRAPEAPPAS